MKRVVNCALALLMLLALAAPARADVLWTPNNSFYERHYGDCEYVGRSYYANGQEGFVTLWDAPGGSVVEGQFQNGAKLRVYWRYEDWGCITVWGDETGEISGWAPMADLYLVYDHISFEEEYGDQFRDYNGEFAGYDGTTEGIMLWEYPNAPEPRRVLEENEDYLTALVGTTGTPSCISKVYTDEQGEIWGYVGYLYGDRNFWVCLTNPRYDNVMLSCIPETDQLFDAGVLIPAQTPELPTAAYMPYILVGAVVVVTAGLLLVFFRRQKKTNQD